MKKILSKGICAGVVALLIAMAAVPSIGMLSQPSNINQETDVAPEITASREETVTLTVTEYPPDGNPTTRDVPLTRSDAEALHQALDEAQGLAEQLAILQEYGVIPVDASSEAMLAAVRQDMPSVEPADIWLPPLSMVFFSEVSASFRWGVSLRVGMTPFLDLLDRLLGIDWQRGVDLADLCFAMRGTVYTYGPLGTHRLYLEPGMVFMTGFVGYTIDTVLWRHSFYGAAVMTFTAGLGEHDFDPWFP